MTQRSRNSRRDSFDPQSDLFQIWKESEAIAMHFNELIIQLRIRALAGIAATTALFGFITKGDTPEQFRWGILAAAFFMLSIVWVAIWILDHCYYTRLLLGSVRAILDIEKHSQRRAGATALPPLKMSHRIEETVAGDFSGLTTSRPPNGIVWFYTLVLITLLLGFAGSLDEYRLKNERAAVAGSTSAVSRASEGRLYFGFDAPRKE